MTRPPFPALLILTAALMFVVLVSACTKTVPTPSTGDEDAVLAEADRLVFAQIEQDHQLHRDREVLAAGQRQLARTDLHPWADRIAQLMIESAVRLPDLETAAELALSFPERFPRSPVLPDAMMTAAAGLAAGDRPRDALTVYAALADSRPDPALVASIAQAAEEPLLALDEPALTEIQDRKLAGRALQPLVGRHLAARRQELGDLAGAEAIVLELEATAPGHAETIAARQALTGDAAALVRGATRPGRLGVLCPLTGRYARFGNAFQAAVRQAVDAVDPAGMGPWELVLEDTEADPVTAALATRKLCGEDGCQLVIGALLSSTTATAALVAERYGIPLVSPTATNERLGLLGDHVLQTNLTGPLEAEVLARLASEVLLKRRFAIIRPDTPEGASLAGAFAAAVARYGGQVELEEIFDPAATDFRTQVHAVRAIRPEVVFCPASVDQMVLLGPQLDFYKVGALVLGPSEWNSQRLMQRAGSVLERAVCAASQVVYPAEWAVDFRAHWPGDRHDEESTNIARSTYLATRLVLDTLEQSAVQSPRLLAGELRQRLVGRDVEVAGPESYAASVRLVEDAKLKPFPGHLYTEAWQRQVLADSLAAADSLLAPVDTFGVVGTNPPGRD